MVPANLTDSLSFADNGANAPVISSGSRTIFTLFFGSADNGSVDFRIESGGTLNSSGGALGYATGSTATGTVTGSGSSWTVLGLTAGYLGAGALTVSSGATVSDATLTLGLHPGSSGTVTITGAGSQLASADTMVVGGRGTGTVAIESGGKLISTGASITSNLAPPGVQSAVTLTGSGSDWTNNGTLSLNGRGAQITVGTGTTLTSSGLITLARQFTDSATITQTGGTLAANGGLKFSTGTSIYHLQGGTLQVGGTDGIQASTGTYNFDLSGGTVKVTGSNLTTQVNATLATGTTTTLDSNGFSGTWSGNLSGLGSLAKIGSGTFTLSGTNTYGGTTSITTGTLALGADTALPSTTAISVASGATLAVGTAYASAGSLTGAGAVTFNGGGLTVGSDNTDTLFSGTLSGSGSLSKNGTGTLTLSGSNSYAHTTVASGKLIVAASGGNSAIGTGVLTVGPSATFAGSGNVAASLTTMQGTLLPGDTGVGALNFANSLTLAGTSLLQLDLASGSSYDQLFIGGTFTAGGALSVSLLNSFDPVTGASFHLFNTSNPITGTFSSVSLPSLDAGLSWDTSSLYTNGTLAVTTTAVPEPATYGLLIGAIGLVAAIRRRIRS